MTVLRKVALALLLFASSTASYGQGSENDSLIKRAFEKWIGKKLNVAYETGSAFTLVHFKTENGKTRIVDYKSSNPKVQNAFKEIVQRNELELKLNVADEKHYLATVINIAMDDGGEYAHFGDGTTQDLLNFNDLKLPPNTVALSPIVWIHYKPIRKAKTDK